MGFIFCNCIKVDHYDDIIFSEIPIHFEVCERGDMSVSNQTVKSFIGKSQISRYFQASTLCYCFYFSLEFPAWNPNVPISSHFHQT